MQAARFAAVGKPYVLVNRDRGPAEVQKFCDIDEAGKNLMRMAVRQMDLSAQSYHRVLKLARTIADLAGEERIAVQHLAEALQYSLWENENRFRRIADFLAIPLADSTPSSIRHIGRKLRKC